MNIPPIQIPPETPFPVESRCPNAPRKSYALNWENVKINKVSRKLIFDDVDDGKKNGKMPKNDFSSKNKR